MTPTTHLFTAMAALFLLGSDALAASVTCQSRNNQREECGLRGRGEVVLVRQISNTTCVKGRNWDETRNGLYVTAGCGGVFETRDHGHGRPDDRPGQGGGWNGGPGQGSQQGEYRDLVGARASSGEAELRRRGFREARREPAPGGRFVFWRTPARGCIEVRVADGRYQTIRPVGNRECDAAAPPMPPERPVPGGGNRPPGQAAAAACTMQFMNEGGNEATVERQGAVRPGVWEIVLRVGGSRYSCLVNDRSQVISYSQIR
jgi:hypothetical protein